MILKAVREGLGRIIIFFDWLTRPRKLKRTDEAQAQVAQAVQGVSLYQFYACPFCVKTRRAIHRLNLPIAVRDAQNDPVHREELLQGGGRIKVPCLRLDEVDSNGEVTTRWMYESGDIIDYLEKKFA